MKNGGKIIALSAMLFLVCFSVSALDTEVKKNSVVSNLGLYGGQPDGMAMQYGSDNVCLAYFAADGLYCSNDAAASFQNSLSNVGVAKTVEFDQNTGHIYALVGDALLKSEDSGVSFMDLTVNVGSANFGNAIAVGDDRVLIAMNNGVVIISTDGGNSFTSATINANSNISSLAASPTSGTYYAVLDNENDNTLYQSIDGGINWTDMDVHSNGVAAESEFYRVVVDPLDADHIAFTSSVSGNYNYQTFDSGATWQAISIEGQEINSNYVAFDGNGRMYTSSYYSDDNFTTATAMERLTPLSSLYFDILLVDRNDNNLLYTNSGLGLAKSMDGGITWTDNVNGVTSVKTYAIAQSNNKATVWAGCNGGLARTANYTSSDPSWTYPILPDQSISNWQAVWVHPADANTVVAAGGTSIFRTENGNDTTPIWIQSATPIISGGGIKKIIADPSSNDILYAVSYNDDLTGADSGMVMKSTDNGITWTDLAITNQATANCITISEKGALYVGLTGDISPLGVYKYTESAGWTRPSTDLDSYAVSAIEADPDDNNILFATTDNGFYKTEDKGVNWTKITTGINNLNNLSAMTYQSPDLYIAGQKSDLNGAIYKSADAGKTWSLFYTGLKQESFYALLYDGLIWGNDRGLYEGKTRASLKVKSDKTKVKKNKTARITFTLQDKVTDEKLKNKRLKIYKKIGQKRYKLWKTKKTGKKGKVKVNSVIKKVTRFKAKWVPKKASAEEYTSVTSKIKRVRIKK